jgi:hypothetical protein
MSCLEEAYKDQMLIINSVFVIYIQLPNDSILELMPNCQFNNSNFKIDFKKI